MWYNSAFYEEPDAPHEVLQSANGVDWFTMQPNAEVPQFEADGADTPFNQTAFKNFEDARGNQWYAIRGEA